MTPLQIVICIFAVAVAIRFLCMDRKIKALEQDQHKLIEKFAELVSKTKSNLDIQHKATTEAVDLVNSLLDAIEKLDARIDEIQDGKK